MNIKWIKHTRLENTSILFMETRESQYFILIFDYFKKINIYRSTLMNKTLLKKTKLILSDKLI